jgi:hypothetical protein
VAAVDFCPIAASMAGIMSVTICLALAVSAACCQARASGAGPCAASMHLAIALAIADGPTSWISRRRVRCAVVDLYQRPCDNGGQPYDAAGDQQQGRFSMAVRNKRYSGLSRYCGSNGPGSGEEPGSLPLVVC